VRCRRPRPPHKDCGAALLLAIGSVLMIGAISAGLAAAATSSLNNRNTLSQIRDRQYAADGAVEQAITVVRSSTTCTAVSGSNTDSSMNSAGIRVDWLTACTSILSSDGSMYPQRDVVFSACLNTGSACVASQVIVTAQVNFEPATGTVTKTFVQYWSVNR
jgi:hypothetical protein